MSCTVESPVISAASSGPTIAARTSERAHHLINHFCAGDAALTICSASRSRANRSLSSVILVASGRAPPPQVASRSVFASNSRYSGFVAVPGTISTSGIKCGGCQKWRSATVQDGRVFSASASGGRPLVLLAITASGAISSSSCACQCVFEFEPLRDRFNQ